MNDIYSENESVKFMTILLKSPDDCDKLKLLGINISHCSNKQIAAKWYHNLRNILNCESTHPLYNDAMKELDRMYTTMIERE